MLELARAIARIAGSERLVLLRTDMHRRIWKVAQPAGVVRVAMREHDVGHLVGRIAEPLDLPRSRAVGVKLKSSRFNRGLANSPLRLGHVGQPDARVDKCHAPA